MDRRQPSSKPSYQIHSFKSRTCLFSVFSHILLCTVPAKDGVLTAVQWAQHGAVMTGGQTLSRLNTGYGQPHDDWVSLLPWVSLSCCWFDARCCTSRAKINCGLLPDFEEKITQKDVFKDSCRCSGCLCCTQGLTVL